MLDNTNTYRQARIMTINRLSMFAALVLITMPAIGQAGEEHFVLMFGAQQIPNDPDYSHTFATFVRVSWPGDGPCPSGALVEERTVSWLPANGVVRILALFPEPGRNFGLQETIAWCQCNNMRVSMWGPYRCCPELYCLAGKRANLLESGQVRYKAGDLARDSDRVSNCIHAAAGVVGGFRVRTLSPGWGETASYVVLQRYRPYVTERTATPWVASALNLDQHALIRRDWRPPNSGLLGPAYRLLGGENDLQATYGP